MSSSSSAPKPFPGYLVHAPFLAAQAPPSSTGLLPSPELLQRTLPPSPLHFTHPPTPTSPGAPAPVLSLAANAPIPGRVSSVYRATSPTGEKVVLKYANDMLAVLREAEEVYVNLPGGGGLPIPTYWGLFEGRVTGDQNKSLVMMLEDCGEPLQGGFETLTRAERQKLYDALTIFHDIHFQHGSFSPSSVVSQPAPPPSDSTTSPNGGAPTSSRKLTIVGFSQAEWHLCPGENSCPELVQAKKALGLDQEGGVDA
ncbi:pre-mRNA-splicing factor cwc22 [Rhodotorula sp. JG-1b]|nr:pre-mRNA-splicing factor cwc22 [Rhodotorula sp. JG-1b]